MGKKVTKDLRKHMIDPATFWRKIQKLMGNNSVHCNYLYDVHNNKVFNS